jgi:hypothetical protein
MMHRPALLPIALSCLLLGAGAPTATAPAADSRPTAGSASETGLDAAARARLVGEHLLTLQWIGWGDLSSAGRATVSDVGDHLVLRGEQRGVGENASDYLRIDGRIVAATRNGFVFEGEILTRVHHIAEGAECRREGRFTFLTRSGRKYWRLQEMDNPCDGVTDYVDVYFRGI